jgi:tRNA pseudouridine55 synthase
VGSFSQDKMVTLTDLQNSSAIQLLPQLLNVSEMLSHWPSVQLSETASFHLRRGQAVRVPNHPLPGPVQLFSSENLFMGIGEVHSDGRVVPKRLVCETV